MSIYEYNEEYAMRVTYEDGETAGYIRGKEDGKAEGRGQIKRRRAFMRHRKGNFGMGDTHFRVLFSPSG